MPLLHSIARRGQTERETSAAVLLESIARGNPPLRARKQGRPLFQLAQKRFHFLQISMNEL
jgi:hypothetical protein